MADFFLIQMKKKNCRTKLITLLLQPSSMELVSDSIPINITYVQKNTFQSVLSRPFSRVGVIFPLMSSRGRPSSPPEDADEVGSADLTVLFGAAAAP